MNEWELLKENVEPIKSGRNIKILKSALNEKPNELNAREMKRREFESDLRTYSGCDLLSVYYNYIVWVEQNYPLGGNEANLKTLLENCIERFYTSDQYQNDKRLLEVFLKFIKRVDTPLELFTFFHENGFATKLADFYINWSFHLENQKNCRKAAEVLRKGIEEMAEPLASLKRSLNELEVRVAKAIVSDQCEELNQNEDQQRKPLNGLKSKTKKGKTVAPVRRVGNSLKNYTEGLKNSVPNCKQNKVTDIYCDENDPSIKTKVKEDSVPKNVRAVVNVGEENQQKPGKWSENVFPQKVVSTEAKPKFEIHADEESDDDSPEPIKKPTQSNTLKIRPKSADSPPIARFEKPDPFKRFAFNMNKVYAGGEEFSFEEIRGRKWMVKKKREEEALRNKKLEEEVAQLRLQVELLLKSQQSSQQIQDSNQQNANKSDSTSKRSESQITSSADSSAAKSANFISNPTDSSRNGTKTALSLVRDLWNGTLANQTADIHQNNEKLDINAIIDKTEEKVQKKEQFVIYSDTSIMSKPEDKPYKPQESNDYTIALPRTEQTFIGNIVNTVGCASTPVADKSKKSSQEYNYNDIQNTCNFIGGMTAKLSPIVETSREYNSKSSSSSSGTMSTTGGQVVSRRQRAFSDVENIDPFDVNLLTQLLNSLVEPINNRKGFFRIDKSLPKIKLSETVLKLGPDFYKIQKLIATGAYAQVYTAQIDLTVDEDNSCGMYLAQKWFALKVVKQSNEWEFYICDELQKRLNRSKSLPDIELSVMSANPTVMFKDGCVLVDEFAPDGTLMDVVNVCKKKNKMFPNSLTAYFALELIEIVRQIHKQNIIHADIKPDNILVLNFPTKDDIINVEKRTSSLKLIDFGRSIDLSLFPDGTTFNVKVTTKGSQCCEMMDSKPWTFQTDWFGVLDCIHVMLFEDYIKVHKTKENKWEITEKLNRRYHHLIDIWKPLFSALLNIANCNQMPEQQLNECVNKLNKYIKDNISQVIKDATEIEKWSLSALKMKK